jgi:hypothetical protein
MPWKTYREGDRYCVHKLNADDSKGEKVKCFDSEEAAQAHQRALYANVNEFRGEFSDVLVVRELRGDYPDVPFFDDVNIGELTRGDDDPTYLTIPIGKINVKSGNNRFYGEAWVQELERQVRDKRPTGMMGHEDDDPMKFPPEAIFWVGTRRIGELLWGKGYLPPGPPRDRVRRYKAANKTLGTSILAMAEGAWDKARGAFNMLAETLDLRRIDIGPIEKLGIKDLGLIPILTSEMQEDETEQESNNMPEKGKLEYISEMTRDDVRHVPDEVRAAILESVQTPPEVAQVQELRAALGVDDKVDLKAVVTELAQAKEAQAKAAVTNRITELVSDKDNGIAVESVRGIVVELVKARNPQSVEDAETAYKEVSASAHVTELLKATVQSTMGPRQTTPVAGQQGKNKYFAIPQEA